MLYVRMYHLRAIIYWYKFYQILKIVDLVSINLRDSAITCSIFSKMCDKLNISDHNFFKYPQTIDP